MRVFINDKSKEIEVQKVTGIDQKDGFLTIWQGPKVNHINFDCIMKMKEDIEIEFLVIHLKRDYKIGDVFNG